MNMNLILEKFFIVLSSSGVDEGEIGTALDEVKETLAGDRAKAFFQTAIFQAIATVIIGVLLTNFIVKIIGKNISKTKINPTFHGIIRQLTRIFLFVIVFVIASQILGLTISGVAVIGSFGLAISLALKDNLANIASGIIILINKEYEVGDYIKIDGDEGIVEKIGLNNTELLTLDNKRIYIPNSLVAQNSVTNNTREGTRNVHIQFRVPIEADVLELRDEILEIVNLSGYELRHTDSQVVVTNVWNKFKEIEIQTWIKSGDNLEFRYYMNEKIAGIISKKFQL